MDFSKFKVGDWLLAGGGVVMLVLGLALDWASIDLPIGTVSGNRPFDYFLTGGIAWLLVVAAGVIAVLLVVGVIDSDRAPWTLILLGATGLALVLMLLRVILGAGEGLDRGPGMWVAFLAAAISLAGALLNFTSAGGSLKDLTDFNKVRDAFGGPDSARPAPPPPPPPPVGGSMPPPPPPTP